MASRFDWNNDNVLVDVKTGQPPTDRDIAESDRTHALLMVADGEFQTALEAKYKSRACDMRYRTNELPENIKVLAKAYQAAYATWRATWTVPEAIL